MDVRESEVKLQRNSTPFYLSLFLSLQQTKRTMDTAPRASRRRRRSRRHRRHRRGGCCRCCARRGRKSACCEEQLCPHWSASSSSSSSQPLFSFFELPPALSPDVESFAVTDTRGGSERDGRRLCVLGPALPEACSVAKEETLRFVRRGKKLSCSRFTLRDSIEKKGRRKKKRPMAVASSSRLQAFAAELRLPPPPLPCLEPDVDDVDAKQQKEAR